MLRPAGSLHVVRKLLFQAILVLSFSALVAAPEHFSGGDQEATGNEVDQDEFRDLKPFPTPSPAIRRIAAAGEIRIGLQRDYQPFHIEDGRPGYPGIDPEFAEALAGAMNVRLRYEFSDVATLMRMLQDGRIDAAFGGISSSPERARYVRFSDPYLVSGPAALLSRRSLPAESESVEFSRVRLRSVGDLATLESLNVAVRRGTTTEQFLNMEASLHRHRLHSFTAREDALTALLDSQVDALAADRLYLQALLLRRPELLGRFLPLLELYREEHLCIVLAQGDPEFASYLNFFLREMRRTGAQAAIQRRYLENREWIP
ncbi:MAG: transporter substrate-binding domain-containing protein [Leptospirales bacterium]|nr:transporter substrate-binding domain-containing protein [Leptospirales bacterium]